MKTKNKTHIYEAGNALVVTMILCSVALVTLAGMLAWSSGSARQSSRSGEYARSVAAAEAATEKIVGQLSRDFMNGGESYVMANLSTYRQTVPSSTDSSYWSTFYFTDAQGNSNRSYVMKDSTSNYIVLTNTYAGLKGYVSTYHVVSDAKNMSTLQGVFAGVLQDVQLTRIPIFQFAMYSSGDMEISCGQPYEINGRIHCNGSLYIEPDSTLTCDKAVEAVGSVTFGRTPNDPRGTSCSGSVVYQAGYTAGVAAMTLPIGTTNTPTAVREILQPPAALEDPTSPIGRQRFYNQANLVITASNSGVFATSGYFNSFATSIPTNQVALFAKATGSFTDAREGKIVKPIDINVGALTAWSATNTTLRTALGGLDLSSVYVVDRRTIASGYMSGVRVTNGLVLPPLGLAVTTGLPLYVQGHYNQTNAANLGTTNTSTTRPALLAGDALSILSSAWTDANSSAALSSRVAASTTVNAAILAGEVDTTSAAYSGGMENFPRFLESWGSSAIFTYNGSMVKMFPSQYTTNVWGQANVYDPPARNWAYDINFEDPTKLPPLTPSLEKVYRSKWAAIAPGTTNVASVNY